MVRRWGEVVARRALVVLLVGVFAVIGAAAYGSGVFGSLSNGGFDDPASQSSKELAQEQDAFGNRGVDVVAIYSSPTMRATAPAFRAEVQHIVAGIPKRDVTSVVTYYGTGNRSLNSLDGHATQVLISLAGTGQNQISDNYDAVKSHLSSAKLRTDLAGSWAVYGDVNTMVSADLARAESFSLPIVVLLSLLIFGSLVAAAMPAVVGGVAVVGALAVIRMLTGFTEVSVFSINIITLLGTGLAIDYALFVISRYREELAKLPDDDANAASTAIRATMGTAGRTVLFSGLTVAAAMSSLLVFPQNFLRSIGYGGIAAVLVAMLAALTVLPAMLRLLGRRIDAGRLPWRRHRPVSVGSDHGAWARLAHSVMRRPVLYVVVITAALLAIASPFLGVRWGSVDYRVLPPDAPAHVAATRLNTEFGPEQSSASLLLRNASRPQVAAYAHQVEQVQGVNAVQPVATRGDTTLLRAYWDGNSQTQASQHTVQDLRALSPPPGSTVLVGGLSAATVDLVSSVGAHLPWMAGIVVGVMLVLLFVAFGSVVLPVKAVLMNVLSISASFGVVTWIFADGHLQNLLGFQSAGFLDATQPILMLAILFGLSMDYEVFLLSRIREQWDRTGDNTQAVATGLQKTGRIITSAALLLSVVIGAFGASGIVFMKMIGIGMLVALLLDATVVRAMLVPATMKLLGHWNWYAPGPLRRWWERHGLREEEPVPETPEAVPSSV